MHVRNAALLTMYLSVSVVLMAPVPARAASPFDGEYSGTLTNTTQGKNTQLCGGVQNRKITIKNGAFEFTNYSNATKATFHDHFTVGPDGSFKGVVGNDGQLRGTVTAAGMTGDWDVGACHIKLDLKKG